jgi:hypothetical protein
MLAEKFCLLLETLREHNVELRVQSTSPHVPVAVPAKSPRQANGKSRA